MNWLDKFKDKIGPAVPAAEGENKQRPGPNREAGGTVVRAGATPAQTIAKPGVRFQPNHEVTIDLQIKSLLGSGGMGEVYLARQRTWGVDVALKIPNDEIISDPENRHRIVREAEAWTDLGLHPHIAYCYYAQPLGELLLLAIEYVDGGNLRDWIANGRCADLKTGLDLAIQFCHGLEHAHKRGLVHRDIKPENILLTQDGTLKITDFGIVRKVLANPETVESTGAVRKVAAGMTTAGIGTPDYMAPEQWDDQGEIDLRVDIFAFGSCLYEMLCGARPYLMTVGLRQEAPDPGQLRGGKALPERLCILLKQCVDWDRKKRPTGAEEVLAELCATYEEVFGEPCQHAELPELTSQADDWNNRALSYLALGRVEDAEAAWETALEADPRHPESTYNYGLHRWRSAKATDEEVLSNLRGVAESDPSAWLPKYLMAQVHLERGDGEASTEELAKIMGDEAKLAEVIGAKRTAETLPRRHLRRVFEKHQEDDGRYYCCLSADGTYALSGVVCDGVPNLWTLWEVESGDCLRAFEGHAGSVDSIGLSADGRYAEFRSGGTRTLWDIKSGRSLEGNASSACLSAFGRLGLSAGDNGLDLTELATGRCLRTFEAHTEWGAYCLSADERYVLAACNDYALKLWDVESGRCLRTFEGHTSDLRAVFLSADRRLALSGSSEGTVRLWDVEDGRCLRVFFEGWGDSVCLSPDDRYVLTTGPSLRVWELASGRCLCTFGFGCSGGLTADGQFAFTLLEGECTLERWEVGSFEYRAGFRLGQVVRSAEATALANQRRAVLTSASRAFSTGDPVGAYHCLRAARQDFRLRRAVPIVREWARLYSHLRRRTLADCWVQWSIKDASYDCLSADGRYALSRGEANTPELWDLTNRQCVRKFETQTSPVYKCCLSGDGRFALSSHDDGTLRLWDSPSGCCLRTLGGPTENIGSVYLSTDGRFALSQSNDGVKLWDATSGTCLRTFEHSGSLCLIGDGAFVLGGSHEKVKLWEVVSGRCLRTFEGHTDAVHSICLSNDGKHVLSGSWDKTAKLWELASGRCLRTFEAHDGEVTSVCLSADGLFAVLGSGVNTLTLWDVASGRCLRTLEYGGMVGEAFLTPDSRYVISSCGSRHNGSAVITAWFLDWELEESEPADWDEGARPYLEVFLGAHVPYAGTLPKDHQPKDAEITRALTRQGQPKCSEDDFKGLLYTLGCAGYGWLRPEGVRRELEQMTAALRDGE